MRHSSMDTFGFVPTGHPTQRASMPMTRVCVRCGASRYAKCFRTVVSKATKAMPAYTKTVYLSKPHPER